MMVKLFYFRTHDIISLVTAENEELIIFDNLIGDSGLVIGDFTN